MTRLTYARFFPSDWRNGTSSLSVEEEGFLIRCCAFIYDLGLPLPADDYDAARLLRVQPLKYRKLKAALLAKGKLRETPEGLINDRAWKELTKYRDAGARRSDAARSREASKGGAERTTPHPTPGHTSPVRGGVTGVVTPPVDSEKENEINETEARAEHETAHNPEARSQKLDSEGKPSGASAPPTSVEAAIWRDALPWLKQAYGIAADDKAEEAKLRRRLGRLSKDHGNDQVLLALVAAQREPHLHDPLQWMTAWLRKGRGRHARPQPPICDPANAAEFKALYAEFYDDGGRRPHH